MPFCAIDGSTDTWKRLEWFGNNLANRSLTACAWVKLSDRASGNVKLVSMASMPSSLDGGPELLPEFSDTNECKTSSVFWTSLASSFPVKVAAA